MGIAMFGATRVAREEGGKNIYAWNVFPPLGAISDVFGALLHDLEHYAKTISPDKSFPIPEKNQRRYHPSWPTLTVLRQVFRLMHQDKILRPLSIAEYNRLYTHRKSV